MYMRPENGVRDFIIHVLEDDYMLLKYLCMIIFHCEFYENRIYACFEKMMT